eukprot:1849326-Karenia_brevis.AAC.1
MALDIHSQSTIGKLWKYTTYGGMVDTWLTVHCRPIASQGVARAIFGDVHSTIVDIRCRVHGGGKRG